MNLLLTMAVVLGVGIGIVVGLYIKYSKGGRRKTQRSIPSQRRQEPFRPAHPAFNPKTGEWKTWDGTPYGAIESLLMEADGDAVSGDFDGDGLPG